VEISASDATTAMEPLPLARTVNHAARAVRRDAFIEAAQVLIANKGYEALSVQDVLDAVGASKGAFYHYFDSKQALLSAVVDEMTATVLASVQPTLDAPDRTAPQKLNAMFTSIAQWKLDRSDLMFEILETWLSDANAIVREQLRTTIRARLTPMIGRILDQGIAEGTVSIADPEHTAAVFLSLVLAAQDVAGRLFVSHRAGSASLDEVERTLVAYGSAFERVLGVPGGTLSILDRPLIEFWFDRPTESERESAA
jgi:AcrR family transcriptional regulator